MSTYSTAVLADSPYIYWRLNETTGTNAADSGSAGYAGTYTSGFTQNARALTLNDSDPSTTLNGTTGYVTGTGAPATNTGAFSFECIHRVTTAISATGQYLINDQGGVSGHAGRYLYVRDLGYIFGFFDATSAAFANSAVGPVPVLNSTHHVIGTFDGNSTSLIYVDGIQYHAPNVTPMVVTASTNPIVSGKIASGSSNFYGGQIEHVAVYNYALTQDQVLTHLHAAGFRPPTTLNNYQQLKVSDGMSVSEKIR